MPKKKKVHIRQENLKGYIKFDRLSDKQCIIYWDR